VPGRRDEDPALALLGLMLIGDDAEAKLLRKPGDRLVVVADEEGGVGDGLGTSSTDYAALKLNCSCCPAATFARSPFV
jgi:hypothetical protein